MLENPIVLETLIIYNRYHCMKKANLSKNKVRIAGKTKACHYCSTKGNRNAYSIAKYGVGGTKRLMKCRHCGRKYAETYGTLLEGSKLTRKQYGEILKYMLNKVSIIETASHMELTHDTVFNARKRLRSRFESALLGVFRELGFTKVLKKGLGDYFYGILERRKGGTGKRVRG